MSGISAYQQHNVTTQSSGHLIVMLYDGAINFLTQAVEALEAKDYARKGQLIGRAVDIINELNVCLDFESSQEICNNLRSLYLFMTRHLHQANVKCDPRMIRDVIGLLKELNEAWRTISA